MLQRPIDEEDIAKTFDELAVAVRNLCLLAEDETVLLRRIRLRCAYELEKHRIETALEKPKSTLKGAYAKRKSLPNAIQHKPH